MASAADEVVVIGSQTFPLVQKQLHPQDYKPPFIRAQKVPRTDANYRVTEGNIAAIDFGTTSVSLAYTTKGDEKINTLVLDPEENTARDTNAVLFKRKEKVISVKAFGKVARSQFTKLKKTENSDENENIYFERIKLLLKRENNVERQTLVESFSGEKFYLIEVIAFILQYLKEQLIEHLSNTATPLKTTDFDWVITVPAIWDARGKRMMREAAYMAGLITESRRISKFTPISSSPLPVPVEVNPDKLSLALEPEAAALYSQKMIAEQIKRQPSAAAISHPTEYMVIDAGGGTIDITAHVEADGGIVVQNVPTGNAWGGIQVNEEFSKFLQDIVNDPGFEKFIASGDYMKNQAILIKILYDEFEKQKISFGYKKIEEITIDLPRNFARFYEKALITGVKKINGTDYDPDENDRVDSDKSVVESKLFGPVIQGIIDCTLEALEKIENCPSTFYLVGAFGGCKYVHEKVSAAIKKYYQSKGHTDTCSVLIPPTPQLAVATGAVMWRKNPEKFKARRVDATYGIGVTTTFDPKRHNETYKVYNKDRKEDRCRHIFNIFLQKGELAVANKVITTTLTPEWQEYTKMSISIYSTSQLGIQYTADEKKEIFLPVIGELAIDIPNPDNLPIYERKVDITLDFSGTEIHARGYYKVNGKKVNIVCDFLSA